MRICRVMKPHEVRAAPFRDGDCVATHLRIANRQRAQTIGRIAHHGRLTGLPNRALFEDRLRFALARLNHGNTLALHCLSLDRFQSVNCTLGHALGDALLKAVAERLSRILRDTDSLAWLGGDQFAIMQVAPKTLEEVEWVARRVIGELSEPFVLGEMTISVGTSIGIATAPRDATAVEQLMTNADLALYSTKSSGRGTFGFFEQTMQERLQRRTKSRWAFARRSPKVSSSCITSRSWTSERARSSAAKLSCAGRIRSGGRSRHQNSFRSPERSGSSARSKIGLSRPPAPKPSIGRMTFGSR